MRLFKRKKRTKLPARVFLFDNSGEEEILYCDELPENVRIHSSNPSNTVRLHKKFAAKDLFIAFFRGCTNCVCEFGASGEKSLIDMDVRMFAGENTSFKVGNNVHANGTKVHLCNGSSCVIGNDCIFSYNTYIRCSDGHTIIDRDTKQIINAQKHECIIGDNCWIGLNSMIMKNVQLPHDTIVAAGAVVTHKFDMPYTIIGGTPARVIRENVEYDRRPIAQYLSETTENSSCLVYNNIESSNERLIMQGRVLFVEEVLRYTAKIMTMFIFNKQKRRHARNIMRKKLFTKFYGRHVLKTAKSIGKNFFCGGFSNVTSTSVLGDYVNFNGMEVRGIGAIKIGNCFHSGSQCMAITSNHNYQGELIPYDKVHIPKDIEIADFVWLGSRVTLLPGTKIGEGVIIQAGSVVHGEIPPYAIAGGNPAKVFMYRDIEKFKTLKENGKLLDPVLWGETPETLVAVERERERERERESNLSNDNE